MRLGVADDARPGKGHAFQQVMLGGTVLHN